MVSSELALNPYQPVRIERSRARSFHLNLNSPLVVTHVRKLPLYRAISLAGCIETTIVWDARHATESVWVGGRRVVGTSTFWSNVPRFEFSIPVGTHSIFSSIDVEVSWLLFTRGFRLTIGNAVVYREGTL